MATHKTLAFLVLSAILLSAVTSALSYQKEKREDPERRLEECRQKCQEEERGQQKRCEAWCEEEYRKQQQQQEQEERGGQEGNPRQREQEQEDPEHRLQECRQKCRQEQRGEQEQQKRCETRCEERFEQEEEEEQGENNPYFFGRDRFRQLVRTEHGASGILQKFQERSRLLSGLANYRVAFLEANPRAFVVPHHCDVDEVFFVARGRAVIGMNRGQDWETHEIRQGDLIRVRAGTIVYMANNDSNEKLYVVNFLRSVSNPGEAEAFNDAGGKNSYFRAFSREVLEAAFNNKWERIERLFGEQTRETIVRASEEQIRALSRMSEQGGHWTPFGRGEQSQSRPFNLLKKRPSHANDRGQLFEADARDYEELRDIDLRVAFANIKQGSMVGPFYETRSTKVAVVLGGKGIVEMASPQRSRQQQQEGREQQQEREEGREHKQESEQGREQQEKEQGEERYQKVRSELTVGTVFVSPPGHPTVFINSGNENLQLLCFEVNAENNQRIFLTGRNSPLRKLEKEAIQLSFGTEEREAREVLDSQKEEIFFQGPKQGGRGQPLFSILGAAMF